MNTYTVTRALPADECASCHGTAELRPYGLNGTRVCFRCATATAESLAETERQFDARLHVGGPTAVKVPRQ